MQTQVSQQMLKIISYAREEAMRTGEYAISTDHLLLGILRHGDNDACIAMKDLGVDLEEMKAAVEGSLFHPRSIAFSEGDKLSFSRSAQNTLNLCIIEATMAGADKIFATHLLLAITNSSGCASLSYLKSVGVDHGSLSAYMKKNDMVSARKVEPVSEDQSERPVNILKIISSPDKIVS